MKMKSRLIKNLGMAGVITALALSAGCGAGGDSQTSGSPAAENVPASEASDFETDGDIALNTEENSQADTVQGDGFYISPAQEFESVSIDISGEDLETPMIQMSCSPAVKVNGQNYNLDGRALNKVLEDGWTTDAPLDAQLASCQVSDEFHLTMDQVSVKIKLVNPYGETLPLEQCLIAWFQADAASGAVTDSQGFAVGSASYEDIYNTYMAPYSAADSELIFKVFHVSSVSLDNGEKLLDDRDWEMDYSFENGILSSMTAQSPALLYNGMEDNIDPQIISSVDPASFQSAAQTRDSILDQLKSAFAQAQLNVQINETTGEAVMDSNVLFDVDSYELSDEGKAFLESFCGVYASVLFDGAYADRVSAVVFEGHTDTNASYEYNLELSQKRAQAVLDYCLNSAAMTQEQKDRFGALAQAKGYSFSDPVYDENGNVDMDASRRVAVKFYINVE